MKLLAYFYFYAVLLGGFFLSGYFWFKKRKEWGTFATQMIMFVIMFFYLFLIALGFWWVNLYP